MIDIKDEIIQRMKMLHYHPNVIKEFKNEQKLNKSEAPLGILYWLTDDEEERKTDRKNLNYGLVMSYTVSAFAECGLIKIKSINGGLVRAY